jgi:hypothetical protein
VFVRSCYGVRQNSAYRISQLESAGEIMTDNILSFLFGFILCMYAVSELDLASVYDIDGVKTTHMRGHFYRLVEIDRAGK